MTTTELLWEYDTAVWRQRLERTGSDVRLVRAFAGEGPWRGSVPEPVGAVTAPAAVLVLPVECHDGRYAFDLTGDEQLATQLWHVASPGAVLDAFRRLGVLLGRLHAVSPPPGVQPTPSNPNVRRLRAYLEAPSPGATAHAVGSLQPQTLAGLGQVLDTLDAAPRRVLAHGGFSLGSVFADAGHRQVELVTGPELCTAPPELDLGWMIGELTEYELSVSRAGATTDLYSRAAATLRAAYDEAAPAPCEPVLLDGVVAARVALHRFDYVTSTGRAEQTTVNAFIDWLVERWRHERDAGGEDVT